MHRTSTALLCRLFSVRRGAPAWREVTTIFVVPVIFQKTCSYVKIDVTACFRSTPDYKSPLMIGASCSQQIPAACVEARHAPPRHTCSRALCRKAYHGCGAWYYTVLAAALTRDRGTVELCHTPDLRSRSSTLESPRVWHDPAHPASCSFRGLRLHHDGQAHNRFARDDNMIIRRGAWMSVCEAERFQGSAFDVDADPQW